MNLKPRLALPAAPTGRGPNTGPLVLVPSAAKIAPPSLGKRSR